MEEFVNHIGVDELSVYKDLFVWILLLCVFHGEKGACPPSPHVLQRRGMSPLLSPTERAQCFHRKIRVFPRIYQKKANIFPLFPPKKQVSAGFSCRLPAFSGYRTAGGRRMKSEKKHPHSIAGEKKYTYLCIANRRGLLPARTAEGAHRLHTTHTTTKQHTLPYDHQRNARRDYRRIRGT